MLAGAASKLLDCNEKSQESFCWVCPACLLGCLHSLKWMMKRDTLAQFKTYSSNAKNIQHITALLELFHFPSEGGLRCDANL